MRDIFGVHEEKVRRLAKIVKATGAKVVMSSSWRYTWWNIPYENLHKREKSLTDLLNKYGIEVIDATDMQGFWRRDNEIKAWINEHREEIFSFVILDDERYDLECFVGNRMVHTAATKAGQMIEGRWHEDSGLKHKHVKEAIKILQQEYTGIEPWE